jgi:hypothetical protein
MFMHKLTMQPLIVPSEVAAVAMAAAAAFQEA